MTLSRLDITVFVTYLLAVLVVGMLAARRGSSTKRDYFLSGDKLPWWMIGGSIVASNVSSHHLVGIMGTAYSRGFAAMWIVWGTVLIGFNALLWIFLPYYLRNGFYTMPEFLQRRFGSGARLTYVVLVLITYIFVEVSSVLYLGGLSLHALLNVDVMASVVVLALATGAYTIAGGLRAVVWTELLQLSVLVAGGLALTVAIFQKVGGTSAVIADSHNWHMLLPANDPDFPWTMFLGAVCISIYYNAANQFIVQRTLAAKNEWHARMGVVFAGYLDFFMPLVYVVPGLLAPLLFPHLESPDLVFPTLVKSLLSTGVHWAGDGRPHRGRHVACVRRRQFMFHDRHDRSLPALHQQAGQRRASRQIWSLFRRDCRRCWASSGQVSLLSITTSLSLFI